MSQLENKWVITESQIEKILKHTYYMQEGANVNTTLFSAVDSLVIFEEQTKENAKFIDEVLNDLEVIQ